MIIDKIYEDRKNSLGNDKVKYQLTGLIISEIQRKETKNITDTITISVLKKIFQSNTESISYSSDEQKISVLKDELAIIESYLPKVMSIEEISIIVNNLIEHDPEYKNPKNIYPYMKKTYGSTYNNEDLKVVLSKL